MLECGCSLTMVKIKKSGLNPDLLIEVQTSCLIFFSKLIGQTINGFV
jgi:hypothetical protein